MAVHLKEYRDPATGRTYQFDADEQPAGFVDVEGEQAVQAAADLAAAHKAAVEKAAAEQAEADKAAAEQAEADEKAKAEKSANKAAPKAATK
jgi:hypothetical protein